MGWVLDESETFSRLGSNIPATAVWTGAGDRANSADPANWTCRNALGEVLDRAVPTADTRVSVGETGTFNLPLNGGWTGRTLLFPERVTLTADCDWTALDASVLNEVVVDLNGHTLNIAAHATQVQPLKVEGAGTLRLFVDAGCTYTLWPGTAATLVAGAHLVKAGTGELVINRKFPALTDLTIESGSARMALTAALRRDLPVIVKDGATFDMDGKGDNYAAFTIEGFGPDGKGALRSTTGSIGSGTAQMASLALTGDAGVWTGAGDFGLLNTGYAATKLELNGHTLTLNMCAGKSFWLVNVSGSSSGTVLVKSGNAYFHHSSYATSLPNVDFVMDGANSIFRIPTSNYPSKATVRDVTLVNGGSFEEGVNRTYLRNFTVYDNCKVTGGVAWIYVSGTVTVSNETSDIEIFPPFVNNGTYPQLVKQGAGKLTLKNNHTDQRFDRGLDLQGGTVVMDSTASTKNFHVAISSQPAPIAIHAGTTLDMSLCDQPVKISSFSLEEGGTLRHTAGNAIAFSNTTFSKPCPFDFAGTVTFAGTLTFNLADYFAAAGELAPGARLTLFEAGRGLASSATVVVNGCPFEYSTVVSDKKLELVRKLAPSTPAIKIWTVGGTYVCSANTEQGQAISFRPALAEKLAFEGWNVEMTGWRTVNDRMPSGAPAANAAWRGHAGVLDLALKTSALHAGLLEGLETYCMAANEPDFTILLCGDTDVYDGVPDEKVLAYVKEAVARIKAALPMTTVLVSTIPCDLVQHAQLNRDIASWCAAEPDVECVDLASVFTTDANKGNRAQCEAAAELLKAKLLTLATAAGKNTPSTWTRPTVTLGAANNVPAEYLNGFTHVRTTSFPEKWHINQQVDAMPYSYEPPLQRTNIAKVGYYLELVHKTTGKHMAVWADMDAMGPNWADVSFPTTVAQQKQRAVTKLHVWSNTGAVTPVAANDDTVAGYIEFNCLNYSAAEVAAGTMSDPKADLYGFNDTFNTSGTSGHGCFQVMRKFAEANAMPAGEILLTLTRWGATSDNPYGIGIGTLANFGNHGWSADLDRTFCYADSGDITNIDTHAYAVRNLEVWVKYSSNDGPTADATWTGATDSSIWTYANWAKNDGAAPTSYDYCTWRIPQGKDVAFTYPTVDNVTHWATTFLIDGTVRLPTTGGFYNNTFVVGATGRIVYDPTMFCYRLRSLPSFVNGGKFALPAKYANYTKGRFLLCTVDFVDPARTDEEYLADYAGAFDTASAQGRNPKMYVERLATGGGRLWLDLDYGADYPKVNILAIGDSITQGDYGTYGNWRVPLMKKVCAAGYTPWTKGYWTIQSQDINGQNQCPEWLNHAGISGQRIFTTSGGAGTIDGIQPTLDQAGDVDFVLVKLGTNDINSNGTAAPDLFVGWTNLVWQILDRKPHAKVIAGAVVDMAYDAAKDDKVKAFNALMKKAIEVDRLFPAKRVYFSDLYTACYRYDADGNYIAGSFYANNNVHPDWLGEDRLADAYLETIKAAIADDPTWTLNEAETNVPTTQGAETNVPAEYRAGLTRARVLNLPDHATQNLATLGTVPYEDFTGNTAPTENLSRVGYYIELKRKDTDVGDYHGLVRWLWVSMDAFGGCTLDDVGVPLKTVAQGLVRRLRVKTNMPGLADTTADATDVLGWIEFWPSSYTDAAGKADGPAHLYKFDWNDTRTDNMSGYGSMQVHRFTPGAAQPAEVLFAFNRWTVDNGIWEIGLGNFSSVSAGSMDWTFTGSADRNVQNTMAAPAYEVAKIEIWTAAEGDADMPPATVTLDDITTEGNTTTVTGTVQDLGSGSTSAAVTLEWSADPAFATVAGSTAVGTVDALGTVTATVPGLATGSKWFFRFVSTNDRGATGRTAASEYEVSEGLWRPQSTNATWADAAWLKNGAGSATTFDPAWAARFDGQEPNKVAAVAIPSAVTAKNVFVAADANYTFNGAGSITAQKLVKDGTGTLTLDAAVLAGTPDIEIRKGVVKLGAGATTGAAGSNGGTITVKKGGQFDFYHNDNASAANRARALVTSAKKFVIEGAGPDGSGALTSSYKNDNWGSPINEIVMTGDATIGGVGRIDARGNAKNSVTGPADATLTIKNNAANKERGFNIHGLLSVGKVVVDAAGCLTPESGTMNWQIPNGIDLFGTICLWGTSGTWNVGGLRAKGSAARIMSGSGTSYVKTPVYVEPGATLNVDSNTPRFSNAVTNAGTIASASGNPYFDANVENVGNPLYKSTGGALHFGGVRVNGDARMEFNGGSFWSAGNLDWSGNVLDVTLAGGSSFVLGTNNDGYGLPKFDWPKLHVTAASGHSGTFFFHGSTSDSIADLTIHGLLGKFYAQGPQTVTVDMQATNLVFAATDFQIGTSNGYEELVVHGENTDITATSLTVDSVEKNTHCGTFTFSEGLLTIGTGGLTTGWRQPMWPLFTMEGGTLKAGGDFAIKQPGMTANFGTPQKGGKVTVDLNGHNVKWNTGLAGASDVTITGAGSFGPERAGIQGIPTGKWTIESTGTVNLKNAAGFAGGLELAENATATLDVFGTNFVEFVFWTWNGNAWDQMRPRAYGTKPLFSSHLATSLSYINRAQTTVTDVKHGSGTGFNYFGQFYVSAELAGTWRFAHNCKTHSGIIVDGVELSTPGPNTGKIVSVDLAEGWHDFMLSFYNGGSGAIGPNGGDGVHSFMFKVGGSDDGSWPADYTPFDLDHVPMRMRPGVNAKTSVRWRRYFSYGDSVNVYQTTDESKYTSLNMITNSLQIMHTKFSTGVNAPLGGSSTRFDGYFYVSPTRAGQWTFQGGFDDNIALTVDGRKLFATAGCSTATGSMTLREGWHKFKICLGDNTPSGNTSNGTGGLCTDSHSNVVALMFTANGAGYEAFDERYLPIAYQPGDAQKYELTGLGGEVALGDGSRLVNDTLEGGFCPIYGILTGTGTLAGPFRFMGDKNAWDVTGKSRRGVIAGKPAFENPDEQMLAGLKRVKATFEAKPIFETYELSATALGLTAETAEAVDLEVVDVNGVDYSEDFTLAVAQDGRLVLRNAKPVRPTLLLFR